jgi:NodT family efflux transporter outer membrane factor (OMF) lipoprotein
VNRSLVRLACATAALLAGCDLAPAYKAPVTAIPVSYKEAALWHTAHPADEMPREDWWTLFGDPELNRLEALVDSSNQELAAAAAVVDQARATAREAESGLYPSFSVGGRATTDRQSNRRATRGNGQPNQYLDNVIDAQATYEVDLWGRVANAVRTGKAAAQASAADLETERLSLHAELAADYLSLRALDAQAALLRRTIEEYRKALALTQNRFAGKIASGLDVSRAQTQYDAAAAQLDDVAARRALLAHAVAVLAGLMPSQLNLPPGDLPATVPVVDTGLPSTLLERRPDIASAERQMAAANATIGVTKAAFYPTLSLNLLFGLEDTGFNIFNSPDSFWSVGPGLAMPLFEGGLRHAELAAAQAVYRRSVANYKQTVLEAFQDVEDALAQLHDLGAEQQREDAAVAAAAKSVSLSLTLYLDGASSYLEVSTAQEAELQAEQTALDLRARRLQASVNLVRALGGGWTRGDLLASDKPPGNA